jgi:hypothetical protein
MSKVIDILNKISKDKALELKSEKVELALLDGIKRGIGKIFDDIDRSKAILNGAGNQVESIAKNVILKVDNAMESVDKSEDMAKELGVDLPIIKELKNSLASAEKAGKELVKKAKSVQ